MKRIRVMLVFLVLGAIVNVAVAWVIAETVNPRNAQLVEEGYTAAGDGFVHWRVMCYHRRVSLSIDSTWVTNHSELPYVGERPSRSAAEVLPDWAIHRPLIEQGMWIINHFDRAYGWPCLSYWKGSSKSAPYAELGSGVTTVGYSPLTLIWPGFFINTIFYAADIWLLICGPFALRRHLRRKRGLCLKCGYDLKGAEHPACPECGVVIAGKVHA